jgi:hypothetical protein
MSLELVIQENTNAIRDLIATIAKGVPATIAQVAAVAVEAKQEAAGKKYASSAKATAGTSSDSSSSAVDVAEETASTTEPTKVETKAAEHPDGNINLPTDAPTYQDAASIITKLAKSRGRDAAVAVLTKFGAAKLPDVKPEQFAAVIAAANAALEA